MGILLWVLVILTLNFYNTATAGRVYDEERLSLLRDEVKSMFYQAYDSYMQNAYPYDELRPLTCDGLDTWGSYSLTLIDALDTLAILGNYSEFRRVTQLIIDNTQFDLNINVSVFETNIRIVGGLLSAHLLSHKAGIVVEKGWPCNGPLLHLAEKVARKLLPAFDTKTGMPYGTTNLRYGVPSQETPITCTAGVGTFLVEFGTLSRLTGDPLYEKVALRAMHSLYSKRSNLNLFGNHIDTETGLWTAVDSGIGAGVDSFFEYMVKGGILLQRPELMNMFKVSYEAIEKYLGKGGWYIWATMGQGHISTATFQSLEAYWPGLLSLIGKFRPGLRAITNYHRIWKQYGALPELYNILQGKSTSLREGYPLRPELAESAMYLYRATRDPYMLEIGEDILTSIKTMMKTDCGFATVRDVTTLTLEDRMESFFLAETIKYLYLLFDPKNFIHNNGDEYTVIENPLGKCTVYAGGYIFNTEAHPIDPSALHCCTGITEQELYETMSSINEIPSAPKFHGRVKNKTKQIRKRKDSPNFEQVSQNLKVVNRNTPAESELLVRQENLATVDSVSPQINSPSPPHSTILEGRGSEGDTDLQVTFDDDKTVTVVSESSLYCGRTTTSFLQLIKPTANTCPTLKPGDIDMKLTGEYLNKMLTLENLLTRLLEEQKKAGLEFSRSIKLLGTDGTEKPPVSFKMTATSTSSVSTPQLKTTLSDEVKALEKLIKKFEINESPIGPNLSKRTQKKRGWGEADSGQAQTKRNKIQTQEFNETPDLDLIFGTPATGRSLSFYFSLKWLQKFPELITQLIPSERFDIQSFYSRLNQQFSEEGFKVDFNFTLAWVKDYKTLQCDTSKFADRFLFHKSVPPS